MNSFMASIKAQSAGRKYQSGDIEAAKKLYEEAMQSGLKDPRYILSYSVLLLRSGEYQKARELLVEHQKSPLLNAESRKQLFVNYAVCVYKLGENDKAVSVLEGLHQKDPSGLVYQTLGYLYVATGNKEKAVSFNLEALEYDDEDPITLDNLAQAYYLVENDKETAKEYFLKALAQKPGQIDTLFFLAEYDIADGNTQAAAEKLNKALEGRFSPLNHATKEMIEEKLASLNIGA
ncbi:MAG TPA: tetratricopeptide repeat protein [Candidatus Limiplasma sp.]|nr:tetratricopeptide repeat protein [Candidatus Limiplasma sp.]HRX09419.1 tetratricopeptide repeat protein [Candidatus Limiplasma sp.]